MSVYTIELFLFYSFNKHGWGIKNEMSYETIVQLLPWLVTEDKKKAKKKKKKKKLLWNINISSTVSDIVLSYIDIYKVLQIKHLYS